MTNIAEIFKQYSTPLLTLFSLNVSITDIENYYKMVVYLVASVSLVIDLYNKYKNSKTKNKDE